jgi:hypothetical protein
MVVVLITSMQGILVGFAAMAFIYALLTTIVMVPTAIIFGDRAIHRHPQNEWMAYTGLILGAASLLMVLIISATGGL